MILDIDPALLAPDVTHDMSLSALMAFNLGQAGSDLTWTGAKSVTKLKTYMPTSKVRNGLAYFLNHWQDGTCVQHGRACAELEIIHVIPRGNAWEWDDDTNDMKLVPIKRRDKGFGWCEGNLALACRAANVAHKSEPRGIANPRNMARPDLIPLHWPTRPNLDKIGQKIAEARREAAKAAAAATV